MNAVIAIPPVFDFYFTPHRFAVLGAEILFRLLVTKGCKATLLNFPAQQPRAVKQSLPATLTHLKPYIVENESGKLSFFSTYKRLGPSISECGRQIRRCKPDFVFISCFAFCYAHAALDLAENIRNLDSRPRIIIGGAGVSAYPECFIRHPAVDFAFVGEAEVSVPIFVDTLKFGSGDFSRVPNLYYKIDGRVMTSSRICRTVSDEISFVLKKGSETEDRIYFTTALSRGCPKQCRFCSNFLSYGRDFRTIPADTVKSGLDDVILGFKERQKTVYINFEDDNLLCDPAYFMSILDIFKAKFPKVAFLAENGIDYTLLTPDLVTVLIQSGMKQFNMSLTTTNLQVLEDEHRNSSLALYEEIVKVLQHHHIPSITYFICGLKSDSKENVVSTIVYLAGQPTHLGISLFYPVPGILDFQDRTYFDTFPPCMCAGSSAYPWNQSLTTGEMVTAFRLSRFVNLMKSETRSIPEDMLIDKIIHDRKLYTMIKNGRSRELALVPNLDEDMVDLFFRKLDHVEKICC